MGVAAITVVVSRPRTKIDARRFHLGLATGSRAYLRSPEFDPGLATPPGRMDGRGKAERDQEGHGPISGLRSQPSGSGGIPCNARKTSITAMCSGRCSRYMTAFVAQVSVSFPGKSPKEFGSSEATASSTYWNAERA